MRPIRSPDMAASADVSSTNEATQGIRLPPVQFAELVARARLEASQAYVAREPLQLSESLRSTYESYRNIRFRPERSLWRGEPGRFEAQFFHPAFHYRDAVHMFEIDGERTRALPFSTDLFLYPSVPAPEQDKLAFTGVRLHAALNSPSYRDEFVVFQGASYLRSLAAGQAYGLSARALAIDTGEATREEFPRFSELYLVRPAENDADAWVLALLESEHASGAYAFHITPGATTEIEVHARVFMRGAVKVIGLAPMSSMFLFGEDVPHRFDDLRPEVHDSDGLMMWTRTGERIYRPLRNPQRTTVCSFRLDSPRAFGLVQRDRKFESYQDLEARYQDRPSAWIEPLTDWGPGAVRLLEIATPLETDDNIAMLWVPDQVPADGFDLHYRLSFGEPALPKTIGVVHATRVLPRDNPSVRFVIDFKGDGLAERQNVQPVISVSGGHVTAQRTEPNPYLGGYRVSFDLAPEAQDVELRAYLQQDRDVLTETWSYLWQPSH